MNIYNNISYLHIELKRLLYEVNNGSYNQNINFLYIYENIGILFEGLVKISISPMFNYQILNAWAIELERVTNEDMNTIFYRIIDTHLNSLAAPEFEAFLNYAGLNMSQLEAFLNSAGLNMNGQRRNRDDWKLKIVFNYFIKDFEK